MIEQLYTKYYAELLGYCHSLSKNRAFSEDIVQDAFLRAMANCELLGELDEPKRRAWLYRTAKNIFIDNVRRIAKEPPPQNEPVHDEDYSRVAVAMLCARLPDSERTLFTMRYLEGYNATELGELFELPPSTVRARLASARTKMRQLLNEHATEEIQ